MSERAIFLDRDGTLVQARHYPSRPEQLVLVGGILPELRALLSAGWRLVVITNQSGIARGFLTEQDLARMHDALRQNLRANGVELDGIYYCPHHPDGVVEQFAIDCACRKPRPGLLLRAAAELGFDLTQSWFVGDILDDIEAGSRAGCRTALVDLGAESPPRTSLRCPTFVAPHTATALAMIRFVERLGAPVDLTYRPRGWPAARPADLAPAVDGSALEGLRT
jgi:D-glycero-D-manno-heptose 1,7-bisphosphate phosphatase